MEKKTLLQNMRDVVDSVRTSLDWLRQLQDLAETEYLFLSEVADDMDKTLNQLAGRKAAMHKKAGKKS
ncbi:MAG: hypothetical protein J1G30_01205 [Spirochaetales bacterium]|nr:hypothetical protein [Spirochaetales bacterium]